MVGREISEVQEKERGTKERTLPHNIQPHWATDRGQASPMKGGVWGEGTSMMKNWKQKWEGENNLTDGVSL